MRRNCRCCSVPVRMRCTGRSSVSRWGGRRLCQRRAGRVRFARAMARRAHARRVSYAAPDARGAHSQARLWTDLPHHVRLANHPEPHAGVDVLVAAPTHGGSKISSATTGRNTYGKTESGGCSEPGRVQLVRGEGRDVSSQYGREGGGGCSEPGPAELTHLRLRCTEIIFFQPLKHTPACVSRSRLRQEGQNSMSHMVEGCCCLQEPLWCRCKRVLCNPCLALHNSAVHRHALSATCLCRFPMRRRKFRAVCTMPFHRTSCSPVTRR
jgi:hypothetical protein